MSRGKRFERKRCVLDNRTTHLLILLSKDKLTYLMTLNSFPISSLAKANGTEGIWKGARRVGGATLVLVHDEPPAPGTI